MSQNCVIEVVQDGQEKQEFNISKYVLAANSDVFDAMFGHENTKEAREGRVRINDFSTGTAVRQMLIYMRTGELPPEYAIESDAGPLVYIANKYLIDPLVQLIEQGLINSLSLNNVFDRWELANFYQNNSLLSSCGQNKSLFSSCRLLFRRNVKTLRANAEWLELVGKSPELAYLALVDYAYPINNGWKNQNNISISADRLTVSIHAKKLNLGSVVAEKGFSISADFSGPAFHYFEVTKCPPNRQTIYVGLSTGNIPHGTPVGDLSNSYAIRDGSDHCFLERRRHVFEIKPKWNGQGVVIGCGLVLNSAKEIFIFFTGNGVLMEKIKINPSVSVDTLFPTVSTYMNHCVFEANFGDNSAKPFTYDIDKCPGLVFE